MATITIQKGRYTVNSLFQWDKDQVLKIYGLSLPSVPEIHFTNDSMDRAIVKQSSMDSAGVISVSIPNSLLQKPCPIKAYVCIYDGDTFESLHSLTIPVKARKKPSDYTIEDDEEIYSFNLLENRLANVENLVSNHVETIKSNKDNVEALTKKVKTVEDTFTKKVETIETATITTIYEAIIAAGVNEFSHDFSQYDVLIVVITNCNTYTPFTATIPVSAVKLTASMAMPLHYYTGDVCFAFSYDLQSIATLVDVDYVATIDGIFGIKFGKAPENNENA